MLKKIILAGSLLLLTNILTAQYKPILFGLRTGGSIDWMKPNADQYENEGIKLGFTWGFLADFFMMEKYSILTGFNVQYLNGKLSYPEYLVTADTTLVGTLTRNYHIQYIQVPVVLKMQADVSENVKLFGKIGIGTALRLRAKADDVLSSGATSDQNNKVDIANEIALFRESFLIGGGALFTLSGSTALMVDLTFDNGFTNILKKENNVSGVKQKAIVNLVELGVGIVF